MNTLFNKITFESSNYAHFIQSKMQASLTSLEKRVMLAAKAILRAYDDLYAYAHHYFQGTPVTATSEKLAKNRRYAQEQQAAETPKGFVLEEVDDLPQTVQYQSNAGIIVRTIDAEEKEVNGRSVGIASCQGMRETMEDASIAEHNSFQIQNQKYPFDVYAICDGHGGSDCSAFVQTHFTRYLVAALERHNPKELTDEGIVSALEACCQNLDANYKGPSGTTLAAMLILNGKVWVPQVGDSRVIFVKKNGTVIQATEDAKPNIDRYKQEIEKLGGTVEEDEDEETIYRVNGILSMARSIGDHSITGKNGECCLSPIPEITCFSLADLKDAYFVLSCDGLYEVATTNEVGDCVMEMDQVNLSVSEMSHSLTYHALKFGSQDNVSVTVGKF